MSVTLKVAVEVPSWTCSNKDCSQTFSVLMSIKSECKTSGGFQGWIGSKNSKVFCPHCGAPNAVIDKPS